MARAMYPRSSVDAVQKCVQIDGEKGNILLTFGKCACLHQLLNLRNENFVVDSGASMHMISKKNLNFAEMDTLTKSCSPTIVITAYGEVQPHEEAIVYVKELDIFLTLKVLENTPAVLSLGKLCDENGYSYEWINGQKPHLIKKKKDSDNLQYGELRSYSGSRLVKFVLWIFINFTDIHETGESFFFIFFIITLFTYSSRNLASRKGRYT